MKRLIPIFLFLFAVSGCSSNIPSAPDKSEPTPDQKPTLTIEETSASKFDINDFGSVHSPVNGDANEHLIFGNLPVMTESTTIPADLAVFLGRWEGYSFAPPVKKDRKLVLHIAEIDDIQGKLYGWTGTNLQFPDGISEVHFRVVRGDTPAIEFKMTWIDGSTLVNSFQYDKEKDILRGTTSLAGNGTQTDTYELTRDRSFYVYKDYAQYLAGKSITTQEYRNPDLLKYGKGYMLYLPDGYETEKEKSWPLIYFLHGSGDRGDNLLILAKASPFMFIRDKNPLQAIIVAPLLAKTSGNELFPEEYMDGALQEFLTEYRVDSNRIYLTGLSLGGEATYRFALHRPDVFAAISPLCAFTINSDADAMQSIKDIPVWAIHGADDKVVPLARGQKPVDELKAVGGNVKFTILA